jgi:hypothetical protein
MLVGVLGGLFIGKPFLGLLAGLFFGLLSGLSGGLSCGALQPHFFNSSIV